MNLGISNGPRIHEDVDVLVGKCLGIDKKPLLVPILGVFGGYGFLTAALESKGFSTCQN